MDPKDAATGRYQIKILELRQATEQELKTSTNLEVTKARGLALLTEIEATIPQIKSPQTRIKAQFEAAQLLWDVDEKRASKLLADAMTGFKDFLASIDPGDVMFQLSPVSQLRFELVKVSATRDPDAALNFLQSTSQFFSAALDQNELSRQERSIELAIADQTVRNNPNRALQIARQSLKRGYSSSLMNTLTQLRQQNSEMAAELGNEIVAKILNEKLLKTTEAAFLAANLLQYALGGENRRESKDAIGPSPLMSQDKFNELVRKVFDEAMSYSQPPRASYDQTAETVVVMLYTLQSLSAQVDSLVPGGRAAIEKKMGEVKADNHPRAYVSAFSPNSADLSLEWIGKMAPELREQQYIQLANMEANKGDTARARQIINEHVTNAYQRRQALVNIDQQEVVRAMNKGKVEEALRTLSGVRNSRERAQQLAQIANQIGPGHKRAAALNLLEQARNMLGPSLQAPDQDQMFAMFEIARAFSRYDLKRAFEIIDPLIDQFNELFGAARTLDGFGMEYYEGEELNFQNGNSLAGLAIHMSTVLGSTAVINFDRAKVTTDRLRAPEVRLKVYLEIAQQTIKAAK